ncbi:MAG: DUF411 domain-containing protein [Granulosicoccaceae bacterium]|jgi:hypothetical protein
MRINGRLLLMLLGLLFAINGYTGNTASDVIVYKSPACGCCNKWIEHLEQNGFKVEAHNVKDVIPYKIQNGVTPELASCHTAIVDGYTIEGHVPAGDIKRLLRERPAVDGLAVPGMPIGSPGMEQGDRKDKYNVVSFDEKGNKKIFSSHNR